MPRIILMPKDAHGLPVPIMSLNDSHDVDGTAVSAQSNAIDGQIARICAVGSDIRFLSGVNPTAVAVSNFLAANSEIWIPVNVGDKIAVLGGIANISTAGE